jgi:hypothetical protein
MAGKRNEPEEIALKLRQVEVLQGQGRSIATPTITPIDYHADRDDTVGALGPSASMLLSAVRRAYLNHDLRRPMIQQCRVGESS